MVSEKKRAEAEELRKLVEEYPVIGLLDLYQLPSKQLQSIRKDLRGQTLIRMVKKRVMGIVLKELSDKKRNIEKLYGIQAKKPALIFTRENPFILYKTLEKSKSPTYAKPGDIAIDDIVVSAGPTKLLSGPAIGDLQRAKIPVMVKEGKIHVREDTLLVKKGETISEMLAGVLKKLEIQPMEIGINLLGVWEDGVIFEKSILHIDEKEYMKKLRMAHDYALNLSLNIFYPNKESIKWLLIKGYQNAKNLGLSVEIFDRGIIENLINRASIQAQRLKIKLKT